MNRLEMYVREVEKGLCDPNADPTIDKETDVTAVVDGNNGLGAVIGKFCMDLALEKGKKMGIGLVVCHHSNHYGTGATYCLQAIEKGLIGFTCTNTSPLMVPSRAKKAALGTNPISLGAPGLDDDSFILDFATTAVALGKIEIKRRKNKPIPRGWALNKEGHIETDAGVAFEAGMLSPLGGEELNGGYKGYGLAMLVEIFCGILAGSAYGPCIRPWVNPTTIANLGQCFMVINPKSFTDGVEKRMSNLMNYIRTLEPVDPNYPVIVHGDIERAHQAKVCKDGGLQYVQNQHETNEKLAKKLKVCPMKSK